MGSDRARIAAIILAHALFLIPLESAAQGQTEDGPSEAELIILFAVATLVVAGISIYMTREILLRRKTQYEKGSFESQKDRDYEKYHSNWGDESTWDDASNLCEEEEFDRDSPNYYKILGVERTASREEIKRRYRELAKRIHPDRIGGGSDSQMTRINEAYETLYNNEKRDRYDRFLSSA